MHRYDINFVMTMDFEDVLAMYLKAIEKNAIEQLWQQWLVDFSRMDKEHFISFSNYKKEAFKPKNNNKLNKEEILSEAQKIKQADQKGGN